MTPHHTTPHLKHRKYHFPPSTITPVTIYVHLPPLISISFFIRLTIYWQNCFMSVINRPQHSTFILSTMYTPSFITITYKSYNINTIQITNKNNHHNCPPITHTSQTYHAYTSYHIFISYIYFLSFEMIEFCSLVITITIHTHTHKKE